MAFSDNLNINAELYVELGSEAFLRREYEQAFESYQNACRLEPDNEEALAGLGTACLMLDRDSEAASVYERLICLDPDNPKYHRLAGDAYRYGKQYHTALLKRSEACRLAPEWHEPYIGIAYTYCELGKYPMASEALAIAKQLNPEDPRIYSAHGYLCLADKDYEDAIRSYRRAIELALQDGDDTSSLSSPLDEIDDIQAAIHLSKHCSVSHRASLSVWLHNLGTAEYRLCRWDPAVRYLEAAIAAQPDQMKTYSLLILSHLRCGRWRDAWKTYRACLENCSK